MSRKRLLAALLLVCAVAFPPSASADMISLGLVSFDTFIPGPGGTTAFSILNLTGDPAIGGFALPPDFPVVTPLTFDAPLLTWTGASGGSFDFGSVGIAPGSLDPAPQIQFPDTTPFLSATFTATLSTGLFELADGRFFQALSPAITASLLNLDAGVLMPGDFAVLSVDATEVPSATPVPEPASVTLVATGLAVCGFLRRRVKAGPAPGRLRQYSQI
jgi:hypothetical protein